MAWRERELRVRLRDEIARVRVWGREESGEERRRLLVQGSKLRSAINDQVGVPSNTAINSGTDKGKGSLSPPVERPSLPS